jgi:hypothetical protein
MKCTCGTQDADRAFHALDCAIFTSNALNQMLYGDDIPMRVQILNEGAHITAGDRQRDYGSPLNNFQLAGAMKALIRQHANRDISPEELHALDMVLLKIARAVTGKPVRDTYVDGATYFAIAGELALDVS